MGKKLDLANTRFGRLQVVSECARRGKQNQITWLCLCNCGALTEVSAGHLRNGHTRSCGCLARDKFSERRTKHGDCGTRLYRIFTGMTERCYSIKATMYQYYGGKGVKICAEWRYNYSAFKLWALANGYMSYLTIDRFPDNDGDYTPNNCRWATGTEQNINRRLLGSNNISGYCGIFKGKRDSKYTAQISYKRERIHIGTFPSAKEAAIARDDFITANNWPHKLNFPERRK